MKIPEPRKLKSGTWFIQMRLGGESITVSDKDKKTCVAKAAAIKAGLSKNRKSADFTLSEAIDNYIESRSNVLSPSTLRGYRAIQRTRFTPYMDKKIVAFDKLALQKMCNIESNICSAKTLTNAWRFVASVLYEETGLKYDIRLPQIIQKEKAYLSPDQIKTFVKAIKGTDVEIPALLALHSMRRSEILALKWTNINFKKKIIKIEGAAVIGEDGELIQKKENKNMTSRRDIPILIDRLAELLSSAPQKGPLIFDSNANGIYYRINKLCEENNLPKVGVHGLRHSFASLAYHLNIPEKVAMQIGGWKNDATMRRIYTHISKSDIATHAAALSNFFDDC